MAVKHVNGTPDCPECALKLADAHPDLVKWYLEKVKPRFADAHISWSFRDKDSQEQAFLDGKSKLHFPNSKHNQVPALALDLFQLDIHGLALWRWGYFRDISDMAAVDADPILWGGLWKSIGDSDHFQLKQSDTDNH